MITGNPFNLPPKKGSLLQKPSKSYKITYMNITECPDLKAIYALAQEKESVNINDFVIAGHKDRKELYIFLEFSTRRNLRSLSHFDYLFNISGHYKSVKAKEKLEVLHECAACAKVEFFGSILKNKSIRELFIRQQIAKGVTTPMFLGFKEPEIEKSLFHESIKFDRYVKQHQLFLDIQKKKEQPRIESFCFDTFRTESNGVLSTNTLNIGELVFKKLNNNLDPAKRPYKSDNLHLGSSEPDMGKSSLLNFLKTTTACYMGPQDNGGDHYENNLYQFILGDEFSLIGKQTEFLNQFLAGDSMRLAMKGNFTLKQDHPLIIMTSNYKLEDHAARKFSIQEQRETSLKALKVRIEEIEVTESLIGSNFNHGQHLMSKSVKLIKKN